jgi:membrane-associated phospholipid phosphatase
MMTLPLFINKRNRVLMAFICGIAFFLGYSVPNHYHLFTPQLLSLTAFERSIPLIPWTIFVYVSEYWLFVSAYIIFDDELNRNRFIWCYFGVLLIGAFFFVLLPTTYPRVDYPLPTDISALTYRVFTALRAADDPSNCFPSMHVACCYITAFSFLPKEESRFKFRLYFVWATAVALSTLSTKQHYIVDVAGGITLALISYWVFFKRTKYLPMNDFVRVAFRKDQGAPSEQSAPGSSGN